MHARNTTSSGQRASDGLPQIVPALARATRAAPFARKLLVCASPAQGRELLHTLALRGTPWIDWTATTLRQLAFDLAAPSLIADGWRTGDRFDVQNLVDQAIDAVEERGALGPLGRDQGAMGIREAIQAAVGTFRAAGIGPEKMRAARPDNPRLRALAAVLDEYRELASRTRVADGAEILRRAIRAPRVAEDPDERIFLVPGLTRRGLVGRLAERLVSESGAVILETDSVCGRPAPETVLWAAPAQPTGPLSSLHDVSSGRRPALDLFAAATPADEVREVLRRVVAAGLPWDEVEVIATDPTTYGAALDALTRRLGINVTFSTGVSIRRTRVGRVLAAYVRWVSEGFPADVLVDLLEAGDLEAPDAAVSGAALARRLRRLRVGWGHDRYLTVIDHALGAAPPSASGDLDPEEWKASLERADQELKALRALLAPILSATPALVARTRASSVLVSPARLAEGALAFLATVPASGERENTLLTIYRERLERVRASVTRETRAEAALAMLHAHLDVNVVGDGGDARASWTSVGGALHFSDLDTGGYTSRSHSFVIGLDATRVGRGAIEPLITDADRFHLNRASGFPIPPLATATERAAEARHTLAAVLARLRGQITLSYSERDGMDGQTTAPAPELLQALRLREADVSLTYQQLHDALDPLIGAVPTEGRALDATDVWLAAIADGGVPRRALPVVRRAFPGLDRGMSAAAARLEPRLTAYHGLVAASRELDPRHPGGPVLSASRIETLGTCPRQYLYRYVLGVRPFDDPTWDPERWLDPAARGTLLHTVFERTLREARTRGLDPDDDDFTVLALAILGEQANLMARRSPSPSDSVRDREIDALAEDVRSWIAMIREEEPDWRELELRFGPGRFDVDLVTPGGSARASGSIDRVDRLPSGALRVVDYKTGRPRVYLERAPFNGGRRVQHVIYMAAAAQILGAEIDSMEYQFPTRRGENHRVRYPHQALADGPFVLDTLFDLAASGHFLSTESADDCRYCDFATVCRVRPTAFHGIDSPPAAWAKENAENIPEYGPFLKIRKIDG